MDLLKKGGFWQNKNLKDFGFFSTESYNSAKYYNNMFLWLPIYLFDYYSLNTDKSDI